MENLIVTASPHIRDKATTRSLMGYVAISLLPCVLEDLVIARNRAFPAVERTSFRYWGLMLVLLLAIAVFGVYGEGFDPRDFVYFNF